MSIIVQEENMSQRVMSHQTIDVEIIKNQLNIKNVNLKKT